MGAMGAGGAARGAAAMLRALGGRQVQVLLPVPFQTDATQQQLGLAPAGLQAVALGPVVARNLWEATQPPQTQDGSLRAPSVTNRAEQYELLIAAEAVRAAAATWQITSGEALLLQARGIVHGGRTLNVLTVTTDYCGGEPYLYRILAVEQSDASGEG